MKTDKVISQLEAIVEKNEAHGSGYLARSIPLHEVAALAFKLKQERDNTFWRRLTKSTASFGATLGSAIAHPFVSAYRWLFPLPLEKVQAPPVGYRTWAEVPKHLRHGNTVVLVAPKNQKLADDQENYEAQHYGSNVQVHLGTRTVTHLGEETSIEMVSPEKFGLTPRMAKVVRDGKGYEWGSDKDGALLRGASVKLSSLVSILKQTPAQSEEEAQVQLKLLETALGKSAGTFLAEVAAHKAAQEEKASDGADAAVRDALEVLSEGGIDAGSTIQKLKDLAAAIDAGQHPGV